MRVRKNSPVHHHAPRKESRIMMKQLTENGWGDDPWLLRGGDKGAPTLANAAEMVPAGALPPLSNKKEKKKGYIYKRFLPVFVYLKKVTFIVSLIKRDNRFYFALFDIHILSFSLY